jgi:ribosomal protein S11
MKIVLVMLNNLQEYIFDNIQHLKNHNNNDIIVITDKKFNNLFENININIIYIEDLIPDYIICLLT